ncbi:hypothetical protein KP78_09650 [Jeotgalibacillus soli]|uniref:Uncharacterized protein n=1 Tax=Jeotgalibacillus soli TaxID=889306 RepID=A0A0C2VKU9_9BACL|nr:hypothetical protein KP78_09650 [Jeotgalibacillus soli]
MMVSRMVLYGEKRVMHTPFFQCKEREGENDGFTKAVA